MQGDCLAGKPIDAIGEEVEGDCEVAAHGPQAFAAYKAGDDVG
jgi:hypothetical protein